jgi:hypothetical protein
MRVRFNSQLLDFARVIRKNDTARLNLAEQTRLRQKPRAGKWLPACHGDPSSSRHDRANASPAAGWRALCVFRGLVRRLPRRRAGLEYTLPEITQTVILSPFRTHTRAARENCNRCGAPQQLVIFLRTGLLNKW